MDIYDYVRRNFGSSNVNVELQDEDIDLAVDDSICVYNTYGDFSHFCNLKIVEAPDSSGIIPIPDDIEPNFVDTIIYASQHAFTLMPEWTRRLMMKHFFQEFSSGDFTGKIATFLQTVGSLDDLKNILGQYITWRRWDNNKIMITPAPTSGERVGIVYYNIEDYNFLFQDYIFRQLVLAHCKKILGSSYQKYSSIPGASTDITLYQGYRSEGENEIKELIQEIEGKGYIIPIID